MTYTENTKLIVHELEGQFHEAWSKLMDENIEGTAVSGIVATMGMLLRDAKMIVDYPWLKRQQGLYLQGEIHLMDYGDEDKMGRTSTLCGISLINQTYMNEYSVPTCVACIERLRRLQTDE